MLYEQIASNKRKTWVLLIVFFLLLAIVGYAVGYLFMNSGFGGGDYSYDSWLYLCLDHDFSIYRDCHEYEWCA